MNRYAYCHFCDDIRAEVGNKLSLMGMYRGELHVPIMPTFLPKLSLAIYCTTEVDQPFKSMKIVVAWSNGTILQDIELPGSELATLSAQAVENTSPEDPITILTIGANLNIVPFAIENEMTLIAKVIADGEELVAGKLRVKHSPTLAL